MSESEGVRRSETAVPRPFSDLRTTGLLWLINKAVLHPRGYALALHFDEQSDDPETEPTGWSIVYAGPRQCFTYGEGVDEDGAFLAVEKLLKMAEL